MLNVLLLGNKFVLSGGVTFSSAFSKLRPPFLLQVWMDKTMHWVIFCIFLLFCRNKREKAEKDGVEEILEAQTFSIRR